METTYHIPESIRQDTLAFGEQVGKFIAGEISPADFHALHVPMGIYEQRESGVYMVRVRGAAGVFLPHQAKMIAKLSTAYGNGIVHATTRQDLQIHGLRIADAPAVLERLLQVGLSSRGGGGNTVRNISACPRAGVCVDEVFDVTPYALALTEYLIRDRGNFKLPRKFKVAFSGCGEDCGLCAVADLGFFAKRKDGVSGFSVYAAGGMGARSALAIPIEEFVPASAIFEVAEAVKRLFDKHGDRSNRSRARLRFVVERVGADEFRRMYREELDAVRLEGIDAPEVSLPRQACEIPAPSDRVEPDSRSYREWKRNNATAQRQEGLFTVRIPLALGDISAKALHVLANLANSAGDGAVHTAQDQDLHLRGIREDDLHATFLRLHRAGRKLVTAPSIRCVACAGATICRLGVCLSRGLAEAIEQELRDIDTQSILSLSNGHVPIHISGCLNACGQHPIAAIGLYGGTARVNDRVVPFYTIVTGGRTGDAGAALAQPVAKVPARAVPLLLKQFFTSAKQERAAGETLGALLDRWGSDYLRKLGREYETLPSFEEAPEAYSDFGSCRL
jgi:sulfite reductase (ferredoxin)